MLVFLGFLLLLSLLLRIQAPLASAPVVDRFHRTCLQACPRSGHEKFLKAIVCGDSLSSDGSTAFIKSAFIKTGLIHLLIVSGSHLICLDFLVGVFTARWKQLRLLRLGIFFLLLCFVLATGASPPAVRSFAQWCLRELSESCRWAWTRVQTVCAAGFVGAVFCHDRWALGSLALSWIASLALCISTTWFAGQRTTPTQRREARLSWREHLSLGAAHARAWVRAAFITQACVYVLLVPALLSLGVPSVLSIVCNIVLAPAMGFVLFPVSLLAFFCHRLSWLADLAWEACLGAIVTVADRIPGNWDRIAVSQLALIPYIAAMTFWLLMVARKSKRKQMVSIGVLVAAIAGATPSRARAAETARELIVWNVGQGSWATLKSPTLCQHFDIGGERAPLRLIRATCADRLNEVYYSHWDWDHLGLTPEALRALPDLCIEARPGGPAPSRAKLHVIDGVPGCAARPLARELETSSTSSRTHLRNANEFSRVFFEDGVLFPGDSPNREERLWARSPGLSRARILIAGHHGSRTSTSEALLRRLPNLQMIAASARKDRYGHPHREMLARARRALVPVLTTEDWGSLHFELKSSGEVRRPATIRKAAQKPELSASPFRARGVDTSRAIRELCARAYS